MSYSRRWLSGWDPNASADRDCSLHTCARALPQHTHSNDFNSHGRVKNKSVQRASRFRDACTFKQAMSLTRWGSDAGGWEQTGTIDLEQFGGPPAFPWSVSVTQFGGRDPFDPSEI